jgi:hypothetical protein
MIQLQVVVAAVVAASFVPQQDYNNNGDTKVSMQLEEPAVVLFSTQMPNVAAAAMTRLSRRCSELKLGFRDEFWSACGGK